MTGDAVRQLLAEISQRIEIGNGRQEEDTGDAVLSAWSMFATVALCDTPRLVAALTAVLDIHDDNGHGWCQGCGCWNTTFAGWTTRIDECRVRAAVAAALEEQP